jgi:3-methylfumaryl-CoA hydratase
MAASSVVRTEVLGLVPAAGYRDTFAAEAAAPGPGSELPAGWEGVYFPFAEPFDRLRADGSPDGTADVIPDFGLPRRMFAGEDTEFVAPLRFGEEVTQTTVLGDVTEKNGRSGRLVFADAVREYRVGGELRIRSVWHDVFLEAAPAAPAGAAAPAAPAAPVEVGADWWRHERVLDSRHLFRYSALTFNTHRVHYDRAWAREVEGLDDLLVHGPLTRMLLLDAASAAHPERRATAFGFRSKAPLFVDRPITITGHDLPDGSTEVLALAPDGALAARGVVSW